ncbi:MAG: hypothetical protein K2O32_11755 [Acetatifactor sp.]|nr:hypothetical protein [Acetatifactor sp.]
MLTIILKILGILGILLLVLLGVGVTLLLLVLFVPVVYSVRADRRAVCEGEPLQDETEVLPEEYLLRVAAKADWLLGFLRVRFFYPEPGTVTVKVLFFKIFDSGKAEEEDGKTSKSETSKSKKSKSQKHKSKKAAPEESKGSANRTEEAKVVEDKTAEAKVAEDKKIDSKTTKTTNSKPQEESAKQKENNPKRNPKRNAFEKIQYTFQKICDKIKEIYGKIQEARNHTEYYKELLLSEDTKGLLNHAFMRFGKILKSIRPRKLQADIRFGTGAPDTTGYVFGIYGILCSYLGKNVILTPDFERAVLTGELYAAGHITMFKLLWHLLWLVLDKRLWELYSKLKEG